MGEGQIDRNLCVCDFIQNEEPFGIFGAVCFESLIPS